MKWAFRIIITIGLLALGWVGVVAWGYMTPHRHTITLTRSYPISPTVLWQRLTTPDPTDSQTIIITQPVSPRSWKTITQAGSVVTTHERIVTPPHTYSLTIRYAPWQYQADRTFTLTPLPSGTRLEVTETSDVRGGWVNALMGLTGRHTPLKQELNRLAISPPAGKRQ